MFWPFKKKPPAKPFESYITIKENGLGQFSFWIHHEDFTTKLDISGAIVNRTQAEKCAAEYLENLKKQNTIVWRSRVPKGN